MAAAVASGLPRIGGELEAGRLECAVVDAAGDATQRGDVGVGHAGGLPRFLERTSLKRDVQRGGVAPLDPRREHPPLVRDAADERVTKTGEIRRRVPCELPADLTAARLDGAGHETGGLRLAERSAELIEHVPV